MTYGVAKEVARIIKPLAGSTEHHVNNCKEFIEEIKKIKLEEGECITAYDVSALSTSVPVPAALDIINNKLQQDADLPNRTNMAAVNITEVLHFCLSNTYFIFQGVFYEQTKGAAMGSPVSPMWLISLWNPLRQEPYPQHYTHPNFGEDMWMTPV